MESASVPQLSFEILHNGESREFTMPMTSTVSEVRTMFEDLHRERLDKISFQGRELQASQRIGPDCGLQNGDRLVGNIRIIIAEKESERQTLLDVNDSIIVRELMQAYSNKEKRILLDGTALLASKDDKEFPLEKTISLWANGIKDETQLTLVTPEFTIRVREKDAKDEKEFTLKIFDHYRARQIKDAINQVTVRPLGFNDKLIFKDDELNDTVPVFKVQVTDNSLLIIEREDITQERFEYLCADCGSDVRLTKTDAVRCRQCGNRIVFKKRTKKPCQYLAR